jgi:hypothetical protein
MSFSIKGIDRLFLLQRGTILDCSDTVAEYHQGGDYGA